MRLGPAPLRLALATPAPAAALPPLPPPPVEPDIPISPPPAPTTTRVDSANPPEVFGPQEFVGPTQPAPPPGAAAPGDAATPNSGTARKPDCTPAAHQAILDLMIKPPPDPHVTVEERSKAIGVRPDGTLVDPTHLQ